MAAGRDLFGLSAQAKARLVEKLSSAAMRVAHSSRPPPRGPGTDHPDTEAGRLDVSRFEAHRDIRMIEEAADYLGIGDPFFRTHQGIAGAETLIGDRPYTNFASYNYLGINGDPRVAAAAKAAIDRYGTSAAASRMVSGTRPAPATAPRCGRVAWCTANGRSTARWSRHWRAFTARRTPSRWSEAMRR